MSNIYQDVDGNIKARVTAELMGSNVQMPVNISYHEATTIQTHNAVSVGASGNSLGVNTWIDCVGYTKISVTSLCDASVNWAIELDWSNDGTSQHGLETLSSGTNLYKAGATDVKARYLKVRLYNNDVASHTMSAWAYLLA